jgi:hypothetical protein
MWLVNFFETYGHMISTIALVITMGVIIWYALETRKLRKETVKQTELSLRPYVILVRSMGGRYDLAFENIGQSHALDVSIDILEMNEFFYRFQPCHLVRQGKEVTVEAEPFGKNEESERMIRGLGDGLGLPFFEGLDKVKDYPLTVRYKNIEGTPYYTRLEVRVHEKRVVVLKSEKNKV